MNYATVCSGAEAFGPAWHDLGFRPVFHAEIEKNAAAVLRYHFPTVPNYGDFTQINSPGGPAPARPVRLLCGGTPCQSFSLAGLREGINSHKGGLALEFIQLAKRLGAQWVIWENVVGVLSSDEGRAFGSFLGGLAECGYGFAYRVLDAQYFGLAQRRERVFVVGYLGDWRPAAAVLFNSDSLPGYTQPGQAALQTTTGRISGRASIGLSGELNAYTEQSGTLTAGSPSGGGTPAMVLAGGEERVRTLTAIEYELLMGWPKDWTKYGTNEKEECYELATGWRRRICGNGWAAPKATWVAGRIKMVESLTS